MQNYQNILIALDIYDNYEKVLDRGLKIAGSPSEISLVYTLLPEIYFAPYGAAFPTDLTDKIQTEATNKLTEIARMHSISEDRLYVPVGSAADRIHFVANEIGADLIVLGTHGRSGLRLMLGSTANAVLHGVKRDVLAVRIE
ncbi:MAG: universal stress protein [Aestuariibacter sp.]